MVQKVLLTVLVLSWTMPLFMAKHNIRANYVPKQKVSYREEDEIMYKPLPYTELVCNEYQTDKAQSIYPDQSVILAYNIDDNRKRK